MAQALTLNEFIAALTRLRDGGVDGDSEVHACLDETYSDAARVYDVLAKDGDIKVMLDDEY